ncbi:hypothetical protein BC826DRAFT_986246 [Russula brevipes]|nr:hypothetical protein BC826DRAFT_986246 [Russula brevipes]
MRCAVLLCHRLSALNWLSLIASLSASWFRATRAEVRLRQGACDMLLDNALPESVTIAQVDILVPRGIRNNSLVNSPPEAPFSTTLPYCGLVASLLVVSFSPYGAFACVQLSGPYSGT